MHDTVDGIIKTYETLTGKVPRPQKTPGTPGLSMQKNQTDKAVDATKYRTIVGKVMYLVCKLMPEGSNAARELSRHFGNPDDTHWKELDRFVGYLKANKDQLKVIFRKPKTMRIVSNVDSNYATNKDDRKSVSGALHTLGGMLVSWFCKTQDAVTLSSTEAEYISAALAACEMKFLQMLLDEMYFVDLPGIMLEDNTGCIFLVKNPTVGSRTKHIEVRHHFLRRLYDRKEIDIGFVRSDENESDLMTKNTVEKLHNKFAERLRSGTLRVWEKWKDIIRGIDDPTDAQREDVVNWTRVVSESADRVGRINVFSRGQVITTTYYVT